MLTKAAFIFYSISKIHIVKFYYNLNAMFSNWSAHELR